MINIPQFLRNKTQLFPPRRYHNNMKDKQVKKSHFKVKIKISKQGKVETLTGNHLVQLDNVEVILTPTSL